MREVNFRLPAGGRQGFWGKLKKPIMALAPMADVTDAAYRRIIAAHGKPDVMFTEFVSADGLILADKRGKAHLKNDLIFTDAERPIVAQFFSGKPEMIEGAAKLACDLGFDGVDINMGCPDRGIEQQGAGAALIKNPKLAMELIAAAKRGAGPLPISEKTRVGYNKDELDTWIPALLETDLAAISIHARTRKEMSRVPARWDHVKDAVAWRDKLGKKTLILGNGALVTLEDARRRIKETGADGAMLGRAIFWKPFFFFNKNVPSETSGRKRLESPSPGLSKFKIRQKLPSTTFSYSQASENVVEIKNRLGVLLEHTERFEKLL